jgi:hypothetical protein
MLMGLPLNTPRRTAMLPLTPSRTQPLLTGRRRHQAPHVSHAVPHRAHRRPPLFAAHAHHAHEACTACHCWRSPEPPCSCRAGPRRRPTLGPSWTPPPFAPRGLEQSRTPPFCLSTVPLSHHKMASSLLPFHPAAFHPRSSTSSPRMPGSSLPSPISPEMPPPSACSVSH